MVAMIVIRSEIILIVICREVKRPKNTLIKTTNKDLNTLKLTKYMTLYKFLLTSNIHVADFK